MRTNEERIAAMHSRAAELAREKRKKQALIAGAASAAASLALILIIAVQIPHLLPVSTQVSGGSGMSGSIFSQNGALGYIVIGVIAFLLGICVTIFCLKLKQWRDSEDHKDSI